MRSSLSLYLIIIFILIFVFLLIRSTWRNLDGTAAMKRFLNKAKTRFDSESTGSSGNQSHNQQQQQLPQHDDPSDIKPPTEADVLRYRYHHGTNLGSVFIMERWLTPSMYHSSANGSSELAAAESWIKHEGIEKARERHERHWREYVSDADLDWLRNVARCTTVRLPIGYFTLGPKFCAHTPFERVASVYENAWECVRQLVRRCYARGMGVLIDMHGLPGGANAQDHSGTDNGKAEFWKSRDCRRLATKCVCFIAQEARGMEGVMGIQVVNEAEHNAQGMYEWYDVVLSEVSRIDATIPIYISDAWDLNKALTWTQAKNSPRAGQCNPVVIDTHLYWCFSGQDKRKSPQQITSEVHSKLSKLDGKDGSVVDRGAAQAVVGEYSCVLAEPTWSQNQGVPKEQLVRDFGQAESERFQERAGGSFFWTYRMDWMPGGEWGFQKMTEQRAIVPPTSLTFSAEDVRNRVAQAQPQRAQRRSGTVSTHGQYWDTNHPGQYEHWRFEQGWDLGWEDAMAFFVLRSQKGWAGGDKIGMMDLWCLKRFRESGQGGAKFGWEFEQGLRQGVRDFYGCVGL